MSRQHSKRELHADYRRIWNGEPARFSRLHRKDLIMSKRGVIVSRRRHALGIRLYKAYKPKPLGVPYSTNGGRIATDIAGGIPGAELIVKPIVKAIQRKRKGKTVAPPMTTRRFRARVWKQLKLLRPGDLHPLERWQNYVKIGKKESGLRSMMQDFQCLLARAFPFQPTIEMPSCPYIRGQKVTPGDLSTTEWKRLRRVLPQAPTDPIITQPIPGIKVPNRSYVEWFRDLEDITNVKPMDERLLSPNVSTELKGLHEAYWQKVESDLAKQGKALRVTEVPTEQQQQVVRGILARARLPAVIKKQKRMVRRVTRQVGKETGKAIGRTLLGVLTLGIYPAVRKGMKITEKAFQGTRYDYWKLGETEKRALHDYRCRKAGRNYIYPYGWQPTLTPTERKWLQTRRNVGMGRTHAKYDIKGALAKVHAKG